MSEIRRANSQDLGAIEAIEQLSFSVPWSKASLENDLGSQDTVYLVAIEEGQLIGYMGMWQVLDEGNITNIALHPNYRGRGFGKLLLDELISYAKQAKVEKLFLEVRKSNVIAQKLYSKAGFEQIGIRKAYYSEPREDALILQLNL